MTGFTGQTALITGGARGIGLAIAETLQRQDCKVVTLDVDAASGSWPHVQFDLAKTEAIAQTVHAIEEDHGPLDIVINCAALKGIVPFFDLRSDDLEAIFRVNVEAAVFLAQAAGRGMVERRYGRIVNITSIHGSRGAPSCMAYDISKAALGAVTRTLAIELGDSGVLVVGVAPGFVDTRATDLTTERFKTVYQEYGMLPLRRAAQPHEIASQVAWLASPDNTYVTGTCLAVDGGLSATF